jgi:hypothetical protein
MTTRSIAKKLCLIELATIVVALNHGCDLPSAPPVRKLAAPKLPPLQPMPLLQEYAPGHFSNWQEYVSQESKFKVKLPPGRIAESTSQKTMPEGVALDRRQVGISLPDDGGEFHVAIRKVTIDIPEPDEFCRTHAENTAYSIAARSNGKVISNIERVVGNRKGRQCLVSQNLDGQEVSVHTLFVVTNDTYYQVIYSGLAGGPSEADVEHFFAGFELLE